MSIDFKAVDKSLTKPRVRTVVFEKMSVSLPEDKIVGVLGAPGSGKTTLMYLTNGSLGPDRGTIRRQGLLSYPVGSARVFSSTLTGRENLVFVSRLFGFDPKPIINFVLDFTNIGKAIDRQFRLLDRDERTKLVFTSSYAMPFDTFLVDQTVIGGRGEFRDACEDLVEERMKTSGFLIFTSSPVVLRRYCNSFFAIDRKTVVRAENADDAAAIVGGDKLAADDGSTEAGGDDVSE